MSALVWNYCLVGNYKSFNRNWDNLLFIPQSIIFKKCTFLSKEMFSPLFGSQPLDFEKKFVGAQSIHSLTTYRIHTNFLACSYKVYRLCHSTCWQLRMTSKLPILTMCSFALLNNFTFASVLKNKITVTNNIIKHCTLLTNSNDTMSQYLLDSSCVFILVLWTYIFSATCIDRNSFFSTLVTHLLYVFTQQGLYVRMALVVLGFVQHFHSSYTVSQSLSFWQCNVCFWQTSTTSMIFIDLYVMGFCKLFFSPHLWHKNDMRYVVWHNF